MIKDIAQIGNPVLRKKAKEVTSDEDLLQLKQDLEDTLKDQPRGVAIAAPQIFEGKRVFITNVRNTDTGDKSDLKVYINPEIIIQKGDKVKMFEGCLSISRADLFGEVERKSKLEVKYFDLDGKEHKEELTGFEARVFLHEFDHLEGVLFTDLADPKTLMSGEEYSKFRKRN